MEQCESLGCTGCRPTSGVGGPSIVCSTRIQGPHSLDARGLDGKEHSKEAGEAGQRGSALEARDARDGQQAQGHVERRLRHHSRPHLPHRCLWLLLFCTKVEELRDARTGQGVAGSQTLRRLVA